MFDLYVLHNKQILYLILYLKREYIIVLVTGALATHCRLRWTLHA